ncbi:MAG TPA: DALR anticodon-binding domain-containing protein, partial [Phnomibacter sp.]|nr:DALR anticodon-binding domain-containing protein [Phnomibacter sp.]
NPSIIANYAFKLAQTYNSFYAAHSIKNAENASKKALRVAINQATAAAIKQAMLLLGITVPSQM